MCVHVFIYVYTRHCSTHEQVLTTSAQCSAETAKMRGVLRPRAQQHAIIVQFSTSSAWGASIVSILMFMVISIIMITSNTTNNIINNNINNDNNDNNANHDNAGNHTTNNNT